MNYQKLLIPALLLIISRLIGFHYPIENLSWYKQLNTSIQPPGYIFGIVWTILYTLIGLVWYDQIQTNQLISSVLIPLLLITSYVFTPFFVNQNFLWSNAMILLTLLFSGMLLVYLLLQGDSNALLILPLIVWLIQALIFQAQIDGQIITRGANQI